MIVADTSAIAAILFEEPEAPSFLQVIARADRVLFAAPSALELRIVLRRKAPGSEGRADAFLNRAVFDIVDWTEVHLGHAFDALTRFGGRPARLNFGDCMAYALAKSLDLPLLYKGMDFAQTDIRSAL